MHREPRVFKRYKAEKERMQGNTPTHPLRPSHYRLNKEVHGGDRCYYTAATMSAVMTQLCFPVRKYGPRLHPTGEVEQTEQARGRGGKVHTSLP
jgi:hypothetical protein